MQVPLIASPSMMLATYGIPPSSESTVATAHMYPPYISTMDLCFSTVRSPQQSCVVGRDGTGWGLSGRQRMVVHSAKR